MCIASSVLLCFSIASLSLGMQQLPLRIALIIRNSWHSIKYRESFKKNPKQKAENEKSAIV